MGEDDSIKLNDEQQAVVDHTEGPLLVVAGAGTGKTRVITERVKRLITEEGVKPHEILALTFTEKSAREMEERVDRALPYGAVDTWILTFHGFCERVLREHAISIGLDPAYTVLTEVQSQALLEDVLPDLSLQYYLPLGNPTSFINGLLTHFNRLRDEDISVEAYSEFAHSFQSPADTPEAQEDEKARLLELSQIYAAYQEQKVAQSVVDYADLISHTVHLFRERPNALRQVQEQFKFVLVDEFQDTNYIQSALLHLVAGDDQNIMVVGDDDQSIFRWRGAAVYNVLDFEKQYPKATVETLVKNYRSSQEILDAAYTLIQHNNPHRLEEKLQLDKKLQSQVAGEAVIEHRSFSHGDQEVIWVVDKIQELLKSGDFQLNDLAILVRANNHSEPFLQELLRRGIPYQMTGGEKWFYNPAVKDLLAYIRVLVDIADSASWYRILTIPQFSIDGVDIARITSYAKKHNKDLFPVLEDLSVVDEISDETHEAVSGLLAITVEHLRDPRKSAGRILYEFMERIGLLALFKDAETEEQLQNAVEVATLFDEVRRFEQLTTKDTSARSFAAYIDLVLKSRSSGNNNLADSEGVHIITVHGAKGLEFPVVFMVNLIAGRFPSINRSEQIPVSEQLVKETLPASPSEVHLQEERRLFYVGMTRAQQELYLTSSQIYGRGVRARKPSPFIAEALGSDSKDISPNSTEKSPLIVKPPEVAPSKSVTARKVETLSYSEIDTFTVCPLQYKYSYILKLPGEKSAAASYGSTLHNTLRDFYNALMKGEEWDVEDAVGRYHKLWKSEGFTDKRIEELRKEEGEEALRVFIRDQFDPSVIPSYIEKPFSVTIGDVRLKGVIDRIDMHPDGSVEIIDYKTSKPLTEKQLQKNKQLSLYALAATSPQFLNIPLEKLILSFYTFGDHTKRSSTRTEEGLEEARQFVIDQAAEIEKSTFPATVSRLCEYCSYQMLCDTYQGTLQKKP